MYEHKLEVTLVSQFPESAEKMENLVKQFLGPWCVESKSVYTGKGLEEKSKL